MKPNTPRLAEPRSIIKIIRGQVMEMLDAVIQNIYTSPLIDIVTLYLSTITICVSAILMAV